MKLTRRETIVLGFGTAITAMLPLAAGAAPEDKIKEFTGGAETVSEGLTLTAPEIAENGNTVPIEVSAPGAEAILVLAPGNPNPDVGTFRFGPLAGSQTASTRIRLAETQELVAIAKLSDGSFARATKEVKVTIGGCGG